MQFLGEGKRKISSLAFHRIRWNGERIFTFHSFENNKEIIRSD
jgi:hypothetical protein